MHIHVSLTLISFLPPLQAVQAVGYNEEDSSDSEHDAYLERMKAEGGNYDSEDGT